MSAPHEITQSSPDENPGEHVGYAHKLLGSTRHSLGLDSGFMQRHYLQVSSSLRIAAEVLSVLSGQKFKTPERSIAASLAIVSNLLGVAFKQQPQLKEELDRLSAMPMGEYVALRLRQALQPRQHIRQTLAANMMIGGVLGMLASTKSKRIGEGVGAAVGFIGACVLSFTRDEQKAWERHSAIMGSLAIPIQLGYAAEASLKKGDYYIPPAMGLHAASHALTYLETFDRKGKTTEKQDDLSR